MCRCQRTLLKACIDIAGYKLIFIGVHMQLNGVNTVNDYVKCFYPTPFLDVYLKAFNCNLLTYVFNKARLESLSWRAMQIICIYLVKLCFFSSDLIGPKKYLYFKRSDWLKKYIYLERSHWSEKIHTIQSDNQIALNKIHIFSFLSPASVGQLCYHVGQMYCWILPPASSTSPTLWRCPSMLGGRMLWILECLLNVTLRKVVRIRR